MSRFGGPRSSADELAYGDIPQRWDRERFERLGPRGPPTRRFEEDYRFEERERPGRRDVTVADRIDERGPRGSFHERDRYVEEDRFSPAKPRRRTDKELFGDVDPRELAEMAVTPYRRKSISRQEEDIDLGRRGGPPRPGLLRRQSSLDTFDRRPARYEREEYRMPAYQPVPLPIRRRDEFEERDRYRDYAPEDYREVEIHRERSVHRHRDRGDDARSEAHTEARSEAKSRKSRAKSVTAKSVTTRRTSPSSLSSESFEETEKAESIRESIAETERKIKKGKTRMPKRLVRREAVQDLGYPYDEEENFFVLRQALEKEQIDEVIKISEQYKAGGTKTVYRFEEHLEEEGPPPLPPPPIGEHEEVTRTEWVNPPTVIMSGGAGRSVRAPSPSSRSTTTRRTSPARTHRTAHTVRSRSRAPSMPGTVFEERRTVYDDPPPPPGSIPIHSPPPTEFYEDRRTVIEERFPPPPPPGAPTMPSGALVVRERDYRNDRDIQSEIRTLEAERRALRLEREAEDKRNMAVRLRERPTEEEFQMVEYRERRRAGEVLEIVERDRSPPRNVVRVEKDRKERRKKAKIVAAAMATLT